MEGRLEEGIRAALKSLDDTVRPALDATDSLASEQLELVMAFLGFLGERIDGYADFELFRLQCHHVLARALLELHVPDIEIISTRRHRLSTACTDKLPVRPRAARQASDGLATLISELLHALRESGGEPWIDAQKHVLDHGARLAEHEQRWYSVP